LRESTNQWLFVAKKKQGLELGGLYFRRVPLKVHFYGACQQNERKLELMHGVVKGVLHGVVKGVLGVDRR
jgi:hypothetical protein